MIKIATQAEEIDGLYLNRIKEIFHRFLGKAPCRVYLFGSRAAGAGRPGSDLDIAVDADVEVSPALSQIRLALEESTIPLKVDLVDLSRTSKEFRQQVLADGILLWKE
jgi:uncharacterized protein